MIDIIKAAVLAGNTRKPTDAKGFGRAPKVINYSKSTLISRR